MANIRTHLLGQKEHDLAHRKGIFFRGQAAQQHININVGDYGVVRTKRHGLEDKKSVCCGGKVVKHIHHQSWNVPDTLL